MSEWVCLRWDHKLTNVTEAECFRSTRDCYCLVCRIILSGNFILKCDWNIRVQLINWFSYTILELLNWKLTAILSFHSQHERLALRGYRFWLVHYLLISGKGRSCCILIGRYIPGFFMFSRLLGLLIHYSQSDLGTGQSWQTSWPLVCCPPQTWRKHMCWILHSYCR